MKYGSKELFLSKKINEKGKGLSMKNNERLVAALKKAIELSPNVEVGKFIRYISSASDLAYMSDEELAILIENHNKSEEFHETREYEFDPIDKNYLAYMYNSDIDFTKENEQISYDRYQNSIRGVKFFDITEKMSMEEFLKVTGGSYGYIEDASDITVINHRTDILVEWNRDFRHMNGYVVARKGDKYIAKHVYLVKIPSFDELLSVAMLQCKNEYDECLVVTIDWYESPRFTQYTNNIMYGLSYNRSENLVEIYSKHQTIEKFHAFMQKANKIITTWDGILYDDGTFEGE